MKTNPGRWLHVIDDDKTEVAPILDSDSEDRLHFVQLKVQNVSEAVGNLHQVTFENNTGSEWTCGQTAQPLSHKGDARIGIYSQQLSVVAFQH